MNRGSGRDCETNQAWTKQPRLYPKLAECQLCGSAVACHRFGRCVMTPGSAVARRGLIYGGGADRIGGLRMSCVGKIGEGFWPSEGCWAFLFLEGGKQGGKEKH